MSDPHTEPLRVDGADGLWLPESYIGYEGGLVARVPSGLTIDAKPREWGTFHVGVYPQHFGEDGTGTNKHLGPFEVELKRYGDPAETFAVEVADG